MTMHLTGFLYFEILANSTNEAAPDKVGNN